MNARIAAVVLVTVQCLWSAGCHSVPASSAAPPIAQTTSNTPAQAVAEAFIAALNRGEVEGLMAQSGDPFVARTQEWVTSMDGIGFTLGPARDQAFADRAARAAFLRGLIGTVKTEGRTAAARPPSDSSLLDNQLRGAAPRWRTLQLFVFLRGFGDVEHIVLVGVDPSDGMVRALYLN